MSIYNFVLKTILKKKSVRVWVLWRLNLLIFKFRKIVGKTKWFVQFKNIVIRYKKIDYNYTDILRQTACMVVNPIMGDSFASLINCTTTKWRLLLNMFQMVDACLSMLIVVQFVVFLCSCFRSFSSITLLFIICVSLWYFTDEVEEPYMNRTYIHNLELHQN